MKRESERDMEEYVSLMQLCYPEQDMREVFRNNYRKYEGKLICERFAEKLVGGVFLIYFGNDLYGICGMVVHPKFRKNGIGKLLMHKVHTSYKGTFLLRTRDAKFFYEKVGYKEFAVVDGRYVMAYCNKLPEW